MSVLASLIQCIYFMIRASRKTTVRSVRSHPSLDDYRRAYHRVVSGELIRTTVPGETKDKRCRRYAIRLRMELSAVSHIVMEHINLGFEVQRAWRWIALPFPSMQVNITSFEDSLQYGGCLALQNWKRNSIVFNPTNCCRQVMEINRRKANTKIKVT